MNTVHNINIAVLISGSGSNLKALIQAQHSNNLGVAKIVQVISNRANAGGLQHAIDAHISNQVFNLIDFCGGKEYLTPSKRMAYDIHLAHILNDKSINLIVLAGWMHIFSQTFLNTIRVPVINLHPALPGQFIGANAISEAYMAWQLGKIMHTGCMVHEVIESVDAGKVIDTEKVECFKGDTFEDLKQRMHQAEHQLIVRAVKAYSQLLNKSMN